MELEGKLIERAYDLNEGKHRSHPHKYRFQYEHQEMCKRYLSKGEITQDDYDRIIAAMGGEVIKI